MPKEIVQPITLKGQHVELVPLSLDHTDAQIAAVEDGEIYKLWYTSAPAPEKMRAEIERRLALQAAGSMLPFTVIDPGTGKASGMTTFMNVDSANRRVEIGSTWYAKSVQRSGLNTEAKLLLLGHAFNTLDCILRSHQIAPNGTLRDTCVYSILAPEWPTVRVHLQWLIEKPR
jgi:RimJ/RimL family protein N-acetyltransferase